MLAYYSMIQCPRCGFEQPKDRFCAKCGVVMEGFVPKKPSFMSRFGTPLFFVGALGLVFILAASYFFNKKPEVVETNTVSPPPALVQKEAAPQTKGINLAQSRRVIAPGPAAQPTPNQAAAFPSPTAARALAPTPEHQAESSTVLIEFDLVSRDVLDRISQEGDGHLDVGRYSISVVPQFKAKYDAVKADPGFKSLASESRNLVLGQPSLVFRGGKEPKSNETIGFFVEVTPNRPNERGVEYRVSIKRNIPDILPSGELKVASQNFDETLNVPHNSAILMAGLLPRKLALLEGEEELYKTNILKAFLDPAFEKGDSEFLVIINPHFSEPTN